MNQKHERDLWLAFVAGWNAARPDEWVDPEEAAPHFDAWLKLLGRRSDG